MSPERELLSRAIDFALLKTGNPPKGKKPDRGFNWACYCPTCSLIRDAIEKS